MRLNFKIVAYLFVLFVFSGTKAGSYEDFFVAVMRDDASSVETLLRRGFDPNSRDPKGQPGINLAVQRDSARTLKVLLAHPDIDVNTNNAAGENALMLAALKGDLPLCERMLERGGRVDQDGWAPLHYAATGPNMRIIDLLLRRGATVDALSPNRSTPLMMAARYGSDEGVQILLDHGADPKRRNERDLSAADFARLGGRDRLAQRLQALQR